MFYCANTYSEIPTMQLNDHQLFILVRYAINTVMHMLTNVALCHYPQAAGTTFFFTENHIFTWP